MTRPTYSNLAYIHPLIEPRHLNDDGKLKEDVIAGIKKKYTIRGTEYIPYKVLGAGGFGKVYLAQNSKTGEWVAIKELQPRRGQTPAALTQEMAHEHTLLEKVGIAKGKEGHTMAMSLISGRELFAFVDVFQQSLKYTTDLELIQLAISMCDVINEMNSKFDMLLIDIKPENMIYNPSTGRIVPIDFGLARVVDKNRNEELAYHIDRPTGTYMTIAPESLTAGQYSRKSEAYSVARSLADMYGFLDYNSKRVYQKDNEIKMMPKNHPDYNDINKVNIENSTVKEALYDVIMKMLEKNPKRRISLEDASVQFRQIRDEYLKNNIINMKVGIIDLKEFLKLEMHDKENIVTHIANYDKILFIHSDSALSKVDLENAKSEMQYMLDTCHSLARISSTALSNLPHDDLLQKACARLLLESRQNAYHFQFYEIKRDAISIPIDVKRPHINTDANAKQFDRLIKLLKDSLVVEDRNADLFSRHTYQWKNLITDKINYKNTGDIRIDMLVWLSNQLNEYKEDIQQNRRSYQSVIKALKNDIEEVVLVSNSAVAKNLKAFLLKLEKDPKFNLEKQLDLTNKMRHS